MTIKTRLVCGFHLEEPSATYGPRRTCTTWSQARRHTWLPLCSYNTDRGTPPSKMVDYCLSIQPRETRHREAIEHIRASRPGCSINHSD
ncbi:unnamed protein product [Clonostachys solani]|uniref:PD-(D/E)XK nuclease-like domain-containing protein n=1 Tax=Clonostachys solani TaxID=160281 RepID=A0A9N9W977_9HYPO|nr:unnamed protein product [Clonostachys solani]